jgi:DNA-binding SARP family transcriptional activator
MLAADARLEMWRHSPRIRVVGTIALGVDGREAPVTGKVGQVLAALVAEPDGVAFEALAECLWPDRLPGSYRAALHVHLTALRRRLEPTAVRLRSARGNGRCRRRRNRGRGK